MKQIPVITLWQPWATWIARGWKSIETRRHRRFAKLEGQRICIHAGQRFHQEAWEIAGRYLPGCGAAANDDAQTCPLGEIVCTAWVFRHMRLWAAHSSDALCDCDGNMWGLELEDIRVPTVILKTPGQRGIWYLPESFFAACPEVIA